MSENLAYPRFRWLMLCALCTVTAASTAIMISPAPLMGVIAEHFRLSLGTSTGYYMGVFNLFVAISCVCGGIACDRVGLVPVFLFCSVLLIVPTLAIPYAGDSVEGLLVLRSLQALGAGPILSAVSPLAALWFPAQERGIVTGFQGMSVSLGIAVGFVAAPALLAATGDWQVAMAWLSLFAFAGLLVTLVPAFVRKPQVPLSPGDVYEQAHAPAEEVRLAFRQSATWIGVVVVFCYMWILNAFNDLTPAYLAVPRPLGLGFGPMKAGQYMMGLEIAYMAGAVAAGFIMERIFRGRAKPVIALGFLVFAVFAVSILAPAVTSSGAVLLACLMAAGFFQAWIVPNAMAFVALHYPPHVTGKVVGTWVGVGIFGGTAGVLVGAAALRHTGSYVASVWIVGAVALAGLLGTLLLRAPAVFGLTAEVKA